MLEPLSMKKYNHNFKKNTRLIILFSREYTEKGETGLQKYFDFRSFWEGAV